MNMNRFAALAALLTFTGLALWSPSISAAYNTADAVDINVTGLIYADPCTVTVPDTISLGQYARADIAVAGGNTATIPFTIKMTNCPATTTKAAISFNGVPYPDPNMAPAYNVELVALGGPITSGTATFQSPLARVSFRDSATEDSGGDILTHLYLGNTQLIMKAMGCRVETPAITVDLGSVNLGSFANSQTAGTGEQDILLTCEQGTAISASLSAQPASGNNPDNSVIQLSNASAPTSATGVGVQLGIQAPDASFFTDSLPINQKIDLFTHTITTNADGSQTVNGGTMNMSTTLKISARYYKTAATVTPGQANATATLNLTYN